MSRRKKIAFCLFFVIGVVVLFLIYPRGSLEIQIVSSKTLFQKGEVAHFEFCLFYKSNLFVPSVTIPSLNHDVVITGPGGPVYAKRVFVHTKAPITIGMIPEKFGELDWNLCDVSGRPVRAGVYTIKVSLVDWNLFGEVSVEIVDY